MPHQTLHRTIMRYSMAVFYFAAGILHVASPKGFALIPHFVPWPEAVVLFTGICEIIGAIGLVIPLYRRAAGIGLAAYAICVFPANINHAISMISVGSFPLTWWYHGPRLAFQPVLVWWALYCTGSVDWPFHKQDRISQ
jgi:uncharacterized membrane protein